jgi:single-strand DNA-binding protein
MVNKVILIGNLGKDPEISYTTGGTAIAKTSLATTEKWKDRDGNQKDQTEWHNLVFWGKSAEIANQYLRKGSKVFVEGRIQYRTWEDNNGVKRNFTDIKVNNFQMLSPRTDGGGAPQQQSGGYQQKPQQQSAQKSGQNQAAPKQQTGPGETYYEPISNPGQQPPNNNFGSGEDDDLPF